MTTRGLLPSVEHAAEADAQLRQGDGQGASSRRSRRWASRPSAATRGAQIFEAVGLERDLVDQYFTGTTSRIGGIGLDVLAQRGAATATQRAYPRTGRRACRSAACTCLAPRRRVPPVEPGHGREAPARGAPRRPGLLRRVHASWSTSESKRRATLRGLLDIREPEASAVAIEEVEPAKEIVKRFATGAMSLGSLSAEAHETLAIAMNRLGGKSNTGEGGEDPRRFTPDPNGDSRRSAIKQVASGRFGVTIALPRSTPTSSRSRSPRARSPARAASCPATRSTSTSRRSGTPRRASA